MRLLKSPQRHRSYPFFFLGYENANTFQTPIAATSNRDDIHQNEWLRAFVERHGRRAKAFVHAVLPTGHETRGPRAATTHTARRKVVDRCERRCSMIVEKLSLRPREAAQAIGISERTLWSLSTPRGPIPCVRIGNGKRRAVLYSIAGIQAWLSQQADAQKGGEA